MKPIMTREILSPPAFPALSLEEAREHLRLEDGEEDSHVMRLAAAATAHVEMATGRVLVAQRWRIRLDRMPCDGTVELPLAPLLSIEAVRCRHADGAKRELDLAVLGVDRHGDPPTLCFGRDIARECADCAIEIHARFGHGESGAEVPDLLRRAVLMLIAHWHGHAGIGAGEAGMPVVPRGLDRLLSPFRMPRL